MSKIDKLLKVLNMPEMEQAVALYNLGYDVIFDRCRVHWNWVGGGTGKLESIDKAHAGLPYINNEQLADLAFRLNGGLIAGKKPIGWIVNALIEEEKKK